MKDLGAGAGRTGEAGNSDQAGCTVRISARTCVRVMKRSRVQTRLQLLEHRRIRLGTLEQPLPWSGLSIVRQLLNCGARAS